MKKIAVVTGANRGLGFETCRQLGKKDYQVILTCRNPQKGKEAAETLKKEHLDVQFFPMDVSKPEDIQNTTQFITKEFGRLDVLVNNAGVFLDARGGGTVLETKVSTIREAMETNVYGAFQLCQQMIPLMIKNKHGRIVNLSSGLGQLTEMNGGHASYRLTKTAINAVTRIFHDEFHDKNILINSVCPGWVKTDMGGSGAELEITEGVDSIVWLATLPDSGPSGGFFRERKQLPW